ncbi:hypothetical protein B0J11DRAFT_428785 [Dendryphion nanum]|uniref:Histone deacetylase domain-containing protein n=1 Tax=Dendryphion nanum TaxID=256645 RepID=A0A9P9E6B3_9PLEO|nr:hypothetical protein B0J11DRAFT_428785 [Dendryphion nanum]
MPSPVTAKSPLNPHFDDINREKQEKPPLRACDVAEEYFKKELALHEGIVGSAANAGTIVIIHDQCYGHRFSRQKTSKAVLSQIVERPERMLAIVLGISAAYVRLGDRHCDGRHPPHPHVNPPERIPFKIRKTSRMVDLTSPVVTNVHGIKWMEELKVMCAKAEQKLATTGKELAREGGPRIPGQPPKAEFHETDLYLCPESLNALQGALGGVLDAVDAVFTGTSMGTGPSRAFVCVRPPGHHCSADYPSGFCWLNNVHVGIEHAMSQHGLTHAAIIDFDLHHGDGSQAITWERNKKVQKMHKNTAQWKKTSIGYFSLHDINSYPCEYGDDEKIQAASLCIDNAHGQSVWNVHLEAWRTKEEFWKLYEEKYLILIDKMRLYLRHHYKRLQALSNGPTPKAAIFISAGFDASEHEGAGMQRHVVNVPTEFYARFTRDVVRLAEEEGTGVNGRVISVLEGGYSDRALASGALSHISGLTDGQVYPDRSSSPSLGSNMRQRLAGLAVREEPFEDDNMDLESTPVEYDVHWWHESQLEELENMVNPPPAVPKKPARTGPPPNFSSPTQSFAAKVVDPSKMLHRTVSGRFGSGSPSRAPTPPPPEVDWATAAHGLSKLLIPSDRQTTSHRPEDLAEVKIKKEKPQPQPSLASVHVDRSGRQLRGRKPVASNVNPSAQTSDDDRAASRAASRADRRKTIADFSTPSAEPLVPTRVISRRMSIASSVGSVTGDRSVSRASSVVPSRRSVAPTSSAAMANGVPTKKTRGSTTTTSRVPRNAPAVPRVPSAYLDMEKSAPKEKERESTDVEQLSAGLSRVKLTLPATEEEYNARQKAKEAEKKTAAVKPAVKKVAAPRTTKTAATKITTTKAATAGTKKGIGRPVKALKPSSPLDVPLQTSPISPAAAPEEPKIQHAASPLLEQPQPVVPDQIAGVLVAPEPDRRTSLGVLDPPTELTNMTITPEQLPRPAVLDEAKQLEVPVVMSPPRADTPPPPPPTVLPQFVNYNTHTFGSPSVLGQVQGAGGAAAKEMETRAPHALQWMTPSTNGATISAPFSSLNASSRPLSPAKAQGHTLPVFTANGNIPFAAKTNAVARQANVNPPVNGAAENKHQAGANGDVWEVPETPQNARQF